MVEIPLTMELAATERLKASHRLIMGKCCLKASSFIFDRIIIKVAGNQDRHKSSDVFDFRPYHTTHFGIACLWMTKILHFRTWISLRPVGQSWLNFMCSITGGGERLHNVLRQIGSKLWCSWQQKPTLTYNGEKGVSIFSRLLLLRSFLYLQVTRTCIKSRTSSNFGQIGPLSMELAALERLKKSPRLIMGKCCLHASSFIFDRIIIKIAGNEDRHKSSVEFDFGPNNTTHLGVTCPWVTKILHFWTWISLKEKWCLHLFSVVFYFILFILAGNKDMHKISDEFEFRPDWTTDYGVSCPWGLKEFP